MRSQPAATPDLEQVDRDRVRLVWRLTGGLMVSIIVIGLLVLALVSTVKANRAVERALASQAAADRASVQAQAVCHLVKSVAEAPLPVTPRPSPLGLSISAGARIAYVDAGCNLGPLDRAAAQILPYLPPGARYR